MFRKIRRLLQVCLSSNIMLHLAARYQVGDLSFSLFLKIGPIPTPRHSGFTEVNRALLDRSKMFSTYIGAQLLPRGVGYRRQGRYMGARGPCFGYGLAPPPFSKMPNSFRRRIARHDPASERAQTMIECAHLQSAQ